MKQQQSARRSPSPVVIAVPIKFAEVVKNRKQDTIIVQIKTYEQSNLVDVRNWWRAVDGELRPGKGFACSVRHLPVLAKAFAEALAKAKELGLVEASA
jgi:hypothetical protein